MKIDIWINNENGVVYTKPMLEQRALDYAMEVNPDNHRDIAKNVYNVWVKKYDHQVLWL